MTDDDGDEIASKGPRKPAAFEEAELVGPLEVESVEAGDEILENVRCECGGTFLIGTQSHEFDERKGRHYLVDHAQCSQCGRAKKFAFDISGYFAVDTG